MRLDQPHEQLTLLFGVGIDRVSRCCLFSEGVGKLSCVRIGQPRLEFLHLVHRLARENELVVVCERELDDSLDVRVVDGDLELVGLDVHFARQLIHGDSDEVHVGLDLLGH